MLIIGSASFAQQANTRSFIVTADMRYYITDKLRLCQTFRENCGYRKSSFFKIYVEGEKVKEEIYRDDANGGKYTAHETVSLL
ncbi:MAG: hypothetical protein ACOY90_14170 [Candidatus Zhuqueibacterota bacterium]